MAAGPSGVKCKCCVCSGVYAAHGSLQGRQLVPLGDWLELPSGDAAGPSGGSWSLLGEAIYMVPQGMLQLGPSGDAAGLYYVLPPWL